jgi:hypothetical protein
MSIEGYLRALGLACLEGADEPRVRPLLFRLLLLVPKTLCELHYLGFLKIQLQDLGEEPDPTDPFEEVPF